METLFLTAAAMLFGFFIGWWWGGARVVLYLRRQRGQHYDLPDRRKKNRRIADRNDNDNRDA